MAEDLDAFGIELEAEEQETAKAEPGFRNPLNGEIVPPDDVDALIDAYEQADAALRKLRSFTGAIRQRLFELSEGDTKTRRIRGNRRRAKVERPDDVWEQSILKEAWHSFPKYRDEVLTIDRLRVRLREWNKIKNETGPDDFLTFRAMVEKANRGPQGLPKVTIEE